MTRLSSGLSRHNSLSLPYSVNSWYEFVRFLLNRIFASNVSPALRSGVPSGPSGGGCVEEETRVGMLGSGPSFLQKTQHNHNYTSNHSCKQWRNTWYSFTSNLRYKMHLKNNTIIMMWLCCTLSVLCSACSHMLRYLYWTGGAVRELEFVLSSSAFFCFLRITSWSFCFTKELATAPVNQPQQPIKSTETFTSCISVKGGAGPA